RDKAKVWATELQKSQEENASNHSIPFSGAEPLQQDRPLLSFDQVAGRGQIRLEKSQHTHDRQGAEEEQQHLLSTVAPERQRPSGGWFYQSLSHEPARQHERAGEQKAFVLRPGGEARHQAGCQQHPLLSRCERVLSCEERERREAEKA